MRKKQDPTPLLLLIVVTISTILCLPTALDSAPQVAAARAMAAAADAVLNSLSAEQRSKATFTFDDDRRFEFRYTPRARAGLPLKEMTDPQRTLAHALLKTGLSLRGHTAATQIMELENVLRAIEGPRPGSTLVRDPELYFLSIFGTPGKGPWGWKFEGHHLSTNFTIIGDRPVVFAPAFLGVNPAIVRDGPQKGLRVLRDEEEIARELMAAFTDAQRTKVIFDVAAPREMITGENRESTPLAPGGLPMSAMTPAQKRILERLLDVYLGRMAPELSRKRLEALQQAGMESITFGWAGGLEAGGPHYYRMQGRTFLIEYDNTQNNANHIHSVWRDFGNDFGRDLLREHYRADPH
jgi:hypothetical protein